MCPNYALPFNYASFPNSRIEPTPATTQAFTPIVVCPAGVATMVLAEDDNRTYANIRNLSSSSPVYYGYVATIDGTVANGGVILEPLESENNLQSGQTVYVFNPSGSAINIAIDYGEG